MTEKKAPAEQRHLRWSSPDVHGPTWRLLALIALTVVVVMFVWLVLLSGASDRVTSVNDTVTVAIDSQGSIDVSGVDIDDIETALLYREGTQIVTDEITVDSDDEGGIAAETGLAYALVTLPPEGRPDHFIVAPLVPDTVVPDDVALRIAAPDSFVDVAYASQRLPIGQVRFAPGGGEIQIAIALPAENLPEVVVANLDKFSDSSFADFDRWAQEDHQGKDKSQFMAANGALFLFGPLVLIGMLIAGWYWYDRRFFQIPARPGKAAKSIPRPADIHDALAAQRAVGVTHVPVDDAFVVTCLMLVSTGDLAARRDETKAGSGGVLITLPDAKAVGQGRTELDQRAIEILQLFRDDDDNQRSIWIPDNESHVITTSTGQRSQQIRTAQKAFDAEWKHEVETQTFRESPPLWVVRYTIYAIAAIAVVALVATLILSRGDFHTPQFTVASWITALGMLIVITTTIIYKDIDGWLRVDPHHGNEIYRWGMWLKQTTLDEPITERNLPIVVGARGNDALLGQTVDVGVTGVRAVTARTARSLRAMTGTAR